MRNDSQLVVYLGQQLASYSYGDGHPFGPQRYQAFEQAFTASGLAEQCVIRSPCVASVEDLAGFHTPKYIRRVQTQSKTGFGFLDYGDTPAFKGVFEAAAAVVGTTLDAVAHIMDTQHRRAFIPIAGLHHATRDSAAGFCAFNDCGVAIERLLDEYGLQRIAYVDIDAHHGDGVYYAFEDNPAVIFADIHQDGRTLYPGTGHADETGKGEAAGAKLNVPMPPGSDDAAFMSAWESVESFVDEHRPELILFQCGADSLAGDPITELRYSAAAHAHAARRLRELADRHCAGRLLAMGGGGYNVDNIVAAWPAVIRELV